MQSSQLQSSQKLTLLVGWGWGLRNMGSGIFQNMLHESDFCSFVATYMYPVHGVQLTLLVGGVPPRPHPPDMGSDKFQNVLHESVFCSFVATCTLSTGYGLATIHEPLFQFRGCTMTHPRPDGTIKIRPGPDCSRPISAIVPILKRPIRAPYLLSAQAAVPCGAS